MKPKPPFTKVELIRHSLNCFTNGLVGLVPVLGLPFAVQAMTDFCRVKVRAGAQWNPARRYLNWGLACAVLGLLVTIVTGGLFMAVALNLHVSDYYVSD